MTRNRSVYRWTLGFIGLLAILMLIGQVAEVEARGGRGGHGGRHGGMSRHSPAAHGSVRHSRHRGYARHEAREDRREWHEDRWRRRTGAVLTVSAFGALTCDYEEIIVDNIIYSRCDGNWYSRGNQGGEVVYIVVEAPAGY